MDQSLLASGPYRREVYSETGGYHLVYGEPFMMPSLTGRTLVSTGTIG